MSSVSLGPVPDGVASFRFAKLNPLPKQTTPANEQIDTKLNATGRQAVGDQAVQASVERLKKLFDEKNVDVTMSFDSRKGSQITITDGETGKTIFEMPPETVVAMAEKSIQDLNGLIVDKMA